MSQPIFRVGEEVIRQSQTQPELNGDYTIVSCCFAQFTFDHTTFDTFTNVWVYRLGGLEYLVRESNLRKKHKPSEESFKELMNNLNRIPA